MIIETNPCEKCDFCPSFCGIDIDICQMNGESLYKTDEVLENDKIIDFANNQGFEAFHNRERSEQCQN